MLVGFVIHAQELYAPSMVDGAYNLIFKASLDEHLYCFVDP